MMIVLKKNPPVLNLHKEILYALLFIGICSLIINYLWTQNLLFYHTFAELVCIFTSLVIFMTIWYTYEINDQLNHLIGFGFLAVAIFDAIHAIYYAEYVAGQNQLSLWYWLFGRIIEGIVLNLMVWEKYNLSKKSAFLVTVLVSSFCSWLIYQQRAYLPLLRDPSGITVIRLIIEGLVILLFLRALSKIKGKRNEKGQIAYDYIFTALIIAIIAELILMFFSFESVFHGVGHLFKTIYYFFLFKGIFVSVVLYPYERLEDNNQFLINVLNDLPVGVTMYNAHDLKLCFANTKALNLFNCELKNIYGFIPDDIAIRFGEMKRIPHLLLTGSNTERSILLEVQDNTGKKLKLMTDYFKMEDQYLVMFEEAKKEQDLTNLNLQSKAILSSINNPIIITNLDYIIITCNAKTTELFDMEESEIIGKNVYSLFELIKDEREVEKSERLKHDYFKSVQKDNFLRISIVTLKGCRKELLVHTDQIKNVEGDIIGIMITAADITMINQENELQRQNEKLIILGQMAAGVVHEIKNPLTTIKGFSQLIKYKAEDEKILEFARYIDEETDNINKFVADFLLFAKPAPFQLREITINELIESIKTMIETNAFIRKINVSFQINDGEKVIKADLNKIRQVILNITKNAMEVLIEQAHPEIRIRTEYRPKSCEMMIRIHNNGKPMTEEEKLMAGTPFFTTKAKGTGLGLSVCYQIIREHYGRIEIESGDGKGTEFIIVLPCPQEEIKENKQGKTVHVHI